MVRSSFMKLFIAHGVIILLLLFQNCSGGGFSFTSSHNTQDLASAASAPVLTISQAPEPLTSQKSPTFRFSVTTNKFASIKAISCVLDSNPSADCTNGFTAANLSDGDHALKVRAEDSLGNKSEEIVVLWKIDSTKPVVTINQSPSSVIGSTSVGFSFSSDEASVFMCALDNEIMSACTSPVNRTAPEGTHTFKVQSIDSAKNSSDIATATFKVDLTAPIINLLTKPNSPSSGVSATFTYNGTDDGVALSMFSCKLDNQVAAACNSGTMTYSGLTEGSHTFSLTSQDSAGNASPATTYTWIVDTTAPSVPTITANVTNPSKNNTATFLFSATDSNGVKSYECQLDTGAISACLASGVTYTNIVTGSHVFKVRAIDNVGNSSAFTSFSWLVDLSPPVVMLTQTPAASTTATDASFSFTATDTGSGIKTIECQMDAGAFSACTSPKVYSGASVGSHIFNVRVKDQVDNSTTQSFTWSVVAASTPTPTPSPSPTATPSPSPSPTATPAPTPTPVPGSVVFPLHIETGKRYLLDANNNPFFMVGDTPWSLEVSISQADVIKYLDDRKQKGFNTVLFQLMEHCFTVDSSGFNCGTIGKNYYGNVPFNKTGGVWDFTKPIEVYWQQVDFVFAEVAKRNMLALVTPSYVGYGGGEEGWYKDMVSNGATAMRTFGQFVGQRYKNYNNVIWVQGGDYNVADKNLVRSLVAGMKDVLPNSLHTYHGSRYTPSSSFVGSETWLDINTVYTDTTVASNKSSSCYSSSGCGALEIYAQTTKPFFFIEGTYEGMGPDGQGTRSQAYQAILSGAMGQLMGNSPIWFFNSGWQQALNSEGSVSVGMIAKIFAPLKWWLLVPDASGTFLTNQKNRVSYPAAYASDGSFSLVYFTAGTLTINTTMLGGTKVNAYVIDPYNGSKTLMTGSPFTKSTATSFTKTGSNSIGDSDWLLLLEAAP